jgi:hypothetical protein
VNKRYRHWLTKATEGRWPTGIICVDCVSLSETTSAGKFTRRERLESWHAVSMVIAGDHYAPAVTTSGRDPAVFWDMVSAQCDYHQNLWLMSVQCARVWALLGLWERMESGYVWIRAVSGAMRAQQAAALRRMRIKMPNPLSSLSGSALSRLLARDTGYLVAEDPPNILSGWAGGAAHPALWVDTRNYGVDAPPDATPGHDTALWLSAWTQAAVSLLRRTHLGAIRATAGSIASHGWRHNYLQERTYAHCDRDADTLESAGYVGGRCECYRVGTIAGSVCNLDYRSLYPHCCVETRVPCRLCGYSDDRDTAARYACNREWGRIARVAVETDEPAYPY